MKRATRPIPTPSPRTGRKWRVVTLLLALSASATSTAALSPEIERRLSEAGIPLNSVSVASLTEGDALLDHHQADRPMRSASLMKLLTTAVALERLGPAWSWPTEVYAGGRVENGVLHGPLIIKGYGDPSLTLERFWLIVNQLRQTGLHTIEGGLLLDQTHFEQVPQEKTLATDAPWEIVPKPLMVNYQVERIFFEPSASGIQVRGEPDLGWRFRVDLPVVAGPCRADVEDAWTPVIDWGTQTAHIRGKFPQDCGTRVLNVGITDDRYYVAAIFRNLWMRAGGSFAGPTAYGQASEGASLLKRMDSPPLSRAIVDQNKFSNNPMARLLYLSLGRQYRLPGRTTAESADSAVRRWLKEKNLRFPELALENGSGLSRKEQLSAANWVRLLATMQKSPFAPEFEASLPILGMDGTLRRRLSSAPAAGWGRLKTGTLSDASAVAGYLRNAEGRRVAVAFIVNYPNASRAWPAMEAWLNEQFEAK